MQELNFDEVEVVSGGIFGPSQMAMLAVDAYVYAIDVYLSYQYLKENL